MLRREDFAKRITQLNPDKVVFLDEAGANCSMSRSHAWIVRGTELIDPKPMNWGDNLTMIGAIRRRGWVTMSTEFKAANKERFAKWFLRRLLPKLKRGETVVMDNVGAHRNPSMVEAAARRGIEVLYLPPYSPDFNPIESAWALVKKRIRAVAPRTPRALRRVAHRGRRAVKPLHCERWIEHAGYGVRQFN